MKKYTCGLLKVTNGITILHQKYTFDCKPNRMINNIQIEKSTTTDKIRATEVIIIAEGIG